MKPEIPSKLQIRCRRGMLELDIILARYLQRHYTDSSAEERAQFIELLEMQDPPLYRLVTGAIPPPENYAQLMAKISQSPHSPLAAPSR